MKLKFYTLFIVLFAMIGSTWAQTDLGNGLSCTIEGTVLTISKTDEGSGVMRDYADYQGPDHFVFAPWTNSG